MSVPSDAAMSDASAAVATRDQAQADLTKTIADFNPPENSGPQQFNMPEPQDHWNDIVGISPLIMAMGAIGGKFANLHAVDMLASTNAMMKGMVTGNAEQYSDARKQYDQKYEQWKDQQRTWNDTYKAYMIAYKGRVDAQQRAVNGANAAVGLQLRQANLTEKQVQDWQKVQSQIALNDAKIRKSDSDSVSNRIKADSQSSRAATAEKEADIKLAQTREKVKTDDANTLTATLRGLKSEADSILRQYPASGGKRPPEVEAKLKGIRDQMDLVNETLKKHSEKSYTENKAVYDQARQAIASGADANRVKARLSEQGLDPDYL
jgi:hypothetical protein